MAVHSLIVQLSAQVQGYVNGMRQATRSTRELGDQQQRTQEQSDQSSQQQRQHARDLESLGNTAGVAGLAIAAGVGLAIKTYADFDSAMSGVRAQLGGTGADMGKLESAVREAGASSVFSSTEAANAAEELAKAGLSASDIMGSALTGSLSLAAAGGLDLADAATYSANAMQTFGLKASDLGHVADVLTNGAVNSTASVKSLAQGMSQSGLVAKSMGLSLEETVGTLAMFDQAGLKGSDAGTSFKTMLTALANPSKKAADTMRELGINVYDASGNFVGSEKLAGILQNRLGGLTQQQRNAALATIFGSDAIRAATIYYNAGAAKVKEWNDGVRKSGTSALIAAQMQNNWRGDLEKLQGALQDFFIGAGSGADGPLRKLTQWATGFLDALGQIPDPVKSTGLLIAGLGGAALLGISGIIKVGKAMRDMRRDIAVARGAMQLWSIQAGGTGGLISGLGARLRTLGTRWRSMGTAAKVGIGVAILAIGVLGAALQAASAEQENFGRSTSKMTDDLIDAASGGDGLNQAFANLQLVAARDKTLSLSDALKELNRSGDAKSGQWVDELAGGLFKFAHVGTGAATEADAIRTRFTALGEALAELVQNGHADVAARAFAQIQGEAKKAGVSTADLNKAMPAYANALQDVANKQKLAGKSGKENAAAQEAQKKAAQEAADAFKKETDAIANLGNALLEQRGDQVGFEAALDDATKALKDNGRTLDITTEKGRANRTALDQIAESTDKWAANTFKTTGSQRQANAVIAEGRKHYIEMAQAMGMSAEDAKNLADKLFTLPKGTDTSVKVDGIDGAIYKLDKADNLVVSLNGKHVTIPADTPNAEHVAELLYSVDRAALSANGKSVKIPTKAIDSPQTMRDLLGIKGARINADGSVSIPTAALNAAESTRLLGLLGRTATDADGKTVVIPASTPNAAKVISLIGQIHGAQIRTNGKQVVITSSAPLADDVRRKIDNIRGAQVTTNGRSVTINSSVPGYAATLGQIQNILAAAQSKSITISITRAFKTVGAAFPTNGFAWAEGGIVGADGLQKMATGGLREAQVRHRPTLWAEAGPEAYIPLSKDSREPRNIDLTKAVADYYGYNLVKRATGGITGHTAGWSNARPVASSQRVVVDSSRSDRRVEQLGAQVATLARQIAEQPVVVMMDGRVVAAAARKDNNTVRTFS